MVITSSSESSMRTNTSLRALGQFVLPALVLLVLMLYTYARFFLVPYLGFQYFGSGEIRALFTPEAMQQLQLGDRILEANGISHAAYTGDINLRWFAGVSEGDMLRLLVEREGAPQSVEIAAPGFNLPEFISRLFNTWWLSYAFWVAGTIAFFHLHPRDVRRKLLIAFNYLTAIWFIAGTLSVQGVLSAGVVMRAVIWLCLPVYLHLHWSFPKEFGRMPLLAGLALYALGIGGAVLTVTTTLLPSESYALVFLVTVAGSLVMLVVRYFLSPAQRREVGLLLFAVVVSLVPSVLLALAGRILPNLSAGVVISQIVLPGAYLYVVYRRQLGGLELRANRLISFYLFFVLLFSVSLVLVPLLSPYLQSPEQVAGSILITGLLVSLFNIYAFERFQRFIERRLLNIPMPPERLQHSFAGRLSTSFTKEHLAQTLQQEVLPSMLIRESALLHLGARMPDDRTIYVQGVSPNQLPAEDALPSLLKADANTFLSEGWVQLAIPMHVANRPVGLWLLGRKDPDDYYSYAERQLLQSLADQMAIALMNIQQADNLRALHQRSIDNVEARRAFMARELHDDVLPRINEVVTLALEQGESESLRTRQEQLNDRVRQLIYQLRPAMLDYGLYRALLELVDTLSVEVAQQLQISLMLPESDHRYEGHVAEHAYRIVQVAAQNVCKHAQAEFLTISGQLEPNRIELLVEDDGVGFDLRGTSLSDLLMNNHYGLATMGERAALIGAQLNIQSAPGKGTQVHLLWQKP